MPLVCSRIDFCASSARDHVGRAEALRQRELLLGHVDREDAGSAGDARALDGRDADAAAAEHGHGRAGRHARRIDGRADTGGHAAADQRRDLQRDLLAHRHDADRGTDHVLGHVAERAERRERLVAELEPARPVDHQPATRHRAAQERFVAHAVEAAAAVRHERHDHVVARLGVRHAFADLFDHAGPFVAEHERQRMRDRAVERGEIGVADAGRGHLDPDLDRLGPIELDLFDGDLVELEGDDGFHAGLLGGYIAGFRHSSAAALISSLSAPKFGHAASTAPCVVSWRAVGQPVTRGGVMPNEFVAKWALYRRLHVQRCSYWSVSARAETTGQRTLTPGQTLRSYAPKGAPRPAACAPRRNRLARAIAATTSTGRRARVRRPGLGNRCSPGQEVLCFMCPGESERQRTMCLESGTYQCSCPGERPRDAATSEGDAG